MSGDQVEVLYNYSYEDEHGLVEIKPGEVYRLLEKTNAEWWHVCDKNLREPIEDEDGIFVPAQYVRELSEVDNVISSLDDVLNNEAECRDEGSVVAAGSQVEQNRVCETQRGVSAPKSTQRTVSDHTVNGMGRGANEEEVDYVNLDQYRTSANIPDTSLSSKIEPSADVDDSDYVNLPFQQHDHHHLEHGPQLKDGFFVRVLVDGLPWDVYEDHATKRKFFHNRETGELTWKPPRKDKPSSPGAERPPNSADHGLSGKKSTSPVPVFSLKPVEEQTGEEEMYEKKVESGDVYYVNKTTQERWRQLVDETGRQYYHRIGSNDTQWQLPAYTRSKSETQEYGPRIGGTVHDVSAAATLSLTRQSKTRSMYGKMEVASEEIDGSKACTLPPNFAPGSAMEKSPSLPAFSALPSASPANRFEDQLQGYLYKTKIAEMGNKRVKKNWSQVYVVLQTSNLVFYKDHKAAEKKAGSPHGRPEGVISLIGARVSFNPPKEVTGSSRKNTILLSVNSGSQFLLQNDDEKKIHEWLFRLKVIANDLTEDQSHREDTKDLSSSGKTVAASVGVGRSLSTNSDEINPSERSLNWLGIRARLKNFIIRRPTQDDLFRRGILKDSVFGASLQDLCDRNKAPVPNFVLECITAVENKGLEHDGLYRISGNMAEIQRLRYVVEKDEGHNLMEEQWDIHTLTGALKLFFRELREPLFTFKCADKFIEASKKESRKDKLKMFKEALSSLPKCNYETLRVLFQHLKNLIQFSKENRMQTQNVAIVFGPTLMWAEGDFANMAILTVYQSKVVEFILLEYENLFK